jgi:hypothetical protein
MVSECSNCGSESIYHQDVCSYCGGEFHFNSRTYNCVAGRKRVKFRYTSTSGSERVSEEWLRQCPHCKEWLVTGHGTKATTEVHATEEYMGGIDIIETLKTGVH